METLLDWFRTLSLDNLSEIDQHYQEDSSFRDPFTDIVGRDKIHAIFEEMLKLKQANFELLESVVDKEKAFLTWNLHFFAFGKMQIIHGGSYIHFADDGRIRSHRDYWDAAEELYEKIPFLGRAYKLVKKAF